MGKEVVSIPSPEAPTTSFAGGEDGDLEVLCPGDYLGNALESCILNISPDCLLSMLFPCKTSWPCPRYSYRLIWSSSPTLLLFMSR